MTLVLKLAVCVLIACVVARVLTALGDRSDVMSDRYCRQSGRQLQHGWNGKYCVDMLTGKFYRVP